jgi:hypothetical protein
MYDNTLYTIISPELSACKAREAGWKKIMYKCPLTPDEPPIRRMDLKDQAIDSYFEFYSDAQDILVPLAQVVGPMLGAALVAWVRERSGRKVRLKFDGVDAEARSPEQVENLLEQAAEFRARKRKPVSDP